MPSFLCLIEVSSLLTLLDLDSNECKFIECGTVLVDINEKSYEKVNDGCMVYVKIMSTFALCSEHIVTGTNLSIKKAHHNNISLW